MAWHRLMVVLAGALAAPAFSSQALDAIDRPALSSPHASRSVLLSAAKAGDRLVAVGERGIIVLSDDGGTTWRQAQSPVAVTLTAIRFADAKHGYAVGHAGVVLATEDGGNSWFSRFDGKKAARLVLQEAEASKESNELREAQRLVNEGEDKPFLDLHVFDARRVLIVGAYNLAFYTADGGATWRSWMTRLANPKALHWYAVRVKDSTIVLAGEQGLAMRSDDSGATFRRMVTPYHGSFFTAELGSTQDILLAGMRGNVWRSVDGGMNWRQLVAPPSSSVTASTVRSNGQVLLATMGGDLLTASLTASSNILTVERAGLPPLFSILPVSPEQVLTLGAQGAALVNSEKKK